MKTSNIVLSKLFKVIALLFFLSTNIIANGQCAAVGVQVSSSDTALIQLYHAGFFNIPSGFANVCEWEVTTFQGEIVFQDTTSGAAFEQGQVLFTHAVPIADSMKASIIITNDTEGITCTINDTLYWEEIEVLPGSFIGNWVVLSNNGGVEEQITSSNEIVTNTNTITLFPSPIRGYFQIKGTPDTYSFIILDLNGQVVGTYNNIHKREKVDISHFPSGIYFVQFQDENTENLGVKKIIKF